MWHAPLQGGRLWYAWVQRRGLWHARLLDMWMRHMRLRHVWVRHVWLRHVWLCYMWLWHMWLLLRNLHDLQSMLSHAPGTLGARHCFESDGSSLVVFQGKARNLWSEFG